ncbi:MAG: TRAP transporter substrate-binding protein [Proteobacteria bacterium]|nr:TRAP transporter substrate-binding protein [Pseudomonadota bacterium]
MKLRIPLGVTAGLSGILAAAAVSVPTPASAAELLINNYLPPKHPFQLGIVEPWIKDVAAATKGSVDAKLSAAAVGPPPKNWQTVTKGIADLVLLANGFQPNRILLPTISHIPFNSPSAVKTSMALWNSELKYFHKADEFKGAKLLGSFTGSSNYLYTGKQAVESFSDMKGLKLRTSSGVTTTIVEQMGGVAVPSSPSKIFGLVSKGVVDGLTAPGYGLRAFRVLPYVKYATVVPGGFTNTSFTWLMNKKKWDGLTKEQQAQVMSVSGEVISKHTAKVDSMSAAGLDALKKAGGKVVSPSAEFVTSLKKLADAAEAEWLAGAEKKGIDGKAALAYYKSQLK